MSERIQRFLKSQAASSIVYILLGLCLVIMPVKTVYIICKVVFGITMIATGIFHVAIYLLEKEKATLLDLFSGCILMVVGGFLFFNPQVVVKILPILLGTFILIDSVWSLKGAMRMRKQGQGEWKVLLIGSIVFVGLGFILVINPFTVIKYTIIFAGWILLCNGILDLVFLFLLRRGVKAVAEAVEVMTAKEAEVVQDNTPEQPIYEPWNPAAFEKKEQDLSDVQNTVTEEPILKEGEETGSDNVEGTEHEQNIP